MSIIIFTVFVVTIILLSTEPFDKLLFYYRMNRELVKYNKNNKKLNLNN